MTEERQKDIAEIQKLTAKLNEYRNSYYTKHIYLVSDDKYDELKKRLKHLEEKASYRCLSNNCTTSSENESKNEKSDKSIKTISKISSEPIFNISDKTFVIAGSLGVVFSNKSQLKKTIEEHGGTISNVINETTDYLICNSKVSNLPRVEKAVKLNIPILTEEKFIALFSLDISKIKGEE